MRTGRFSTAIFQFFPRLALFVLLASLAGTAQAGKAPANPAPAVAAPVEPARIGIGRPAGFDSLLAPQESVADVYVGGRLVGQAQVRYSSGKVTLLDVDRVVALLPDLIDPAAVRAALAAPDLDSHPDMVCRADDDDARAACGIYRPAVAGVIFDDQRFRLDIFVSPRLLAVHPAAARAYLPRPARGLSLIDQFGGSVGGSGDYVSYGFQNRAILASGEGRIRNDLFYSSTYGLSIDALVAELDKPGLRYSAGAMWAPGTDLVGRRRILGLGIQSQTDTRLDRSVIAGTPLVVSLALRARVDILRDGRLLTSRTYEAGNQTLDTSTLPDGAYEVVLHIQEAGGSVRDERRFFTKNAAIAGIGEPIFFGYAGLLGQDRRDSPLAVTRTPFYQAGIARRFTPHLALDVGVMGTDKAAVAELGGYWLGEAAQVRVAGLVSVRGDTGVLLRANSSGTSRLNFNLDARRIWSRNDKPLIPLGTDELRGFDIASIDRNAQLSAGSFTQVNATISYRLLRGQIGVTGSYRSDPRLGRSYAFGPSVYWPLVERAGMQINLRGDMTLSNRGTTAFIGLSFQRIRPHTSFNAGAGARSTSSAADGNGVRMVGGIGGSWQRDGVLGGDVSLSGGVERESNGTLARARADLNTARAAFAADVAQPIEGDNGSTQYSLNFQTTAAVTPRGIAFQGRGQQDSVIMVAVDGARRGTPFEVLVDNAPRGVVRAGGTLPVSVTGYRQYAVRLRPLGADIMKLDAGAKTIGVYPGNVSHVTWSAQRVVAMFGRIVGPDGQPLANAGVYASGAIGVTDDHGYFQIEAGTNEVLKVLTPNGRECRVPLDAQTNAQGYAALGNLICSRPLPGTRFASADRP